MKKKILATARLDLIPFEAAEVDLLHKTFTDPFVRRYLWDDEIISPDQTKDIMSISDDFFHDEGWGLWKIVTKEKKEYAGFTGLWKFFEEQQPQLLFGLLPAFIHLGYATESSKAIIEHAFSTLQFHHLIASFDVPNAASEKVCQRLGMTKVEVKQVNEKPTAFYRIDKT
jgi:[ribosomal protein S5]-alanine N-acetyltransferase